MAMSSILVLVGIILSFTAVELTAAQSTGVCYGRQGDNLPSQQDVVNLYNSNGIGRMRIYDPDQGTLEALKGSNIELILGVPNDQLQSLNDAGTAANWVTTNVVAYSDVKFRYIAVGNEVDPGDGRAQYVLPAIQNIQNAINSANLQDKIKVSTAIKTSLVANSYPPSDGVFGDDAVGYIRPIVSFIASNGAPLLANVYPYFAYADDQSHSISLDYALFTQQGTNGAGYQNLFDAILDALYSALEKVGATDVNVVVSESGWPSDGGVGASAQNAATYYQNLINHVKGGTPKRPNAPIEIYLFAMFDEDQKQGADSEKHFGIFNPDKSPKYQLNFN